MEPRRMAPLLAFTAVLVGAMVTPTSAAGSLGWTDPPGDATGLDPLPPPADGLLRSSPRPQDAALDLLSASASSDGKTVVFTARTAGFEIPAGATGVTTRFVFSYDGIAFQLIAQRTSADFSTVISSGVFMRSREPSSPELPCRECSVKYDPKSASVTVRAEITSLAAAIKAHSAKAKKFGPGARLTDLVVLAQRNVLPLARDVDVARTLTADAAPAAGMALAI